jgi:hypothetical protein
MDKYVVRAPHGRTNPPDLVDYPVPTEGYMDHHGNFIKYDPTQKELPESLPRAGQPPRLSYDKVIKHLITSFSCIFKFHLFSDDVPTVRNVCVPRSKSA